MKRTVLLLLALFCAAFGHAQFESADAVWSVSVNPADGGVYEAVFEAVVPDGWYIYDQGPYPLPMATSFDFSASRGIETVDAIYTLDEPDRHFSEQFGFEIGTLSGTARFAQKIIAEGPGAVLAGEVDYQICDEENCVRGSWEFAVQVTEGGAAAEDASSGGFGEGRSMWALILEAILWGFAALLTPCVFPMVPMTISFFMKGGEGRASAGFRASAFGLFIVGLYTLPIAVIILVTYFVGGGAVTADIFNWLSTHWIPNVLFFIIFMIFAASLFGAFEIRMPGRLINKTDRGADKNGLIGIFFLALTLVLVSFSCTGPIVGYVLIKSTQGEFWTPIMTMLAFSMAFALPFTMLAFFPSMLNRLPKSGGWMNSVKVVLAFIEVALGFKFLSVADQTYHWGLLDREIYLAIWIVTFTLLGLYLIGKLRFRFDSELKYISVGRLGLAMMSFTFAMYMLPGLWGAPLKGISGYLPPMSTQDFVVAGNAREGARTDENIKYADLLRLPHGMTGYFDLEQGLAAARAAGKPVFLDFTGHGCVNCREMEERVWVDPTVQRILREDFVVVALYSDDRAKLPAADWFTTPEGKVLKTLGKKNSWLVNTRYGVSSQPAYLLLDHDGELLVPVRGYNLDIAAYVEFLNEGLRVFGARR